MLCTIHSGSGILSHRRGHGRRARGQPHRPRGVLVRGHGGAVRVPEAEGALPAAGRPERAAAAADEPVRRGQHRVRPDHHADTAGDRGHQRQRARVPGQARGRRVPGARRGRRDRAQTPRAGQGEWCARARGRTDDARRRRGGGYNIVLCLTPLPIPLCPPSCSTNRRRIRPNRVL